MVLNDISCDNNNIKEGTELYRSRIVYATEANSVTIQIRLLHI